LPAQKAAEKKTADDAAAKAEAERRVAEKTLAKAKAAREIEGAKLNAAVERSKQAFVEKRRFEETVFGQIDEMRVKQSG
jgi:hypothetical protein